MTDEYEEYLRIKAIIDEQIRLLAENPKLKGKTDAQLWGNELRSRSAKAQMSNPEYCKNHQEGIDKRSENIEWHKNRNLALKKVYDTAEWQENTKIANQKNANSVEWQEKNKLGAQKRYKKVSANGIIYESVKDAGIAIASERNVVLIVAVRWFRKQVRENNPLYFYINE